MKYFLLLNIIFPCYKQSTLNWFINIIKKNKKLHIFKQVSMISQWTMKQSKYYYLDFILLLTIIFNYYFYFSIFSNHKWKCGFQIKIQITNVVKVIWKSFWPLLPFLAISYREKWFLRNFICWHLFLVAKNLQTFNETTFNQICVISFWL